MRIKTALLACGLAAMVTLGAAPLSAQPVPVGNVAVNTHYYSPMYYVNHLVFFDAYGRPMYYSGGQAYYVPNTYFNYPAMIRHYRMYQNQYRRWYGEMGWRLRNYQRPIAANYYTPQYYGGYVVYYDGAGRPYYYVNGARTWVPATWSGYHRLRRHWRLHRRAYHRWHTHYGRAYRYYHRPILTSYYTPLYYDGYVVYYDGAGRPYYWAGGRRIWVPRTYAGYNRYHSYWRTHRAHYRRWNREHGRRYRSYRRARRYRGRRAVPTARVPRYHRRNNRAVRTHNRGAYRHNRAVRTHNRGAYRHNRTVRRNNRAVRRNNRAVRRDNRRRNRRDRRNNRRSNRRGRRGDRR